MFVNATEKTVIWRDCGDFDSFKYWYKIQKVSKKANICIKIYIYIFIYIHGRYYSMHRYYKCATQQKIRLQIVIIKEHILYYYCC